MYQHPLERVLLYTDKDSFEDFALSKTEYSELYELYITTKDDVLDSHISAAKFFNEVFYYITHIYDDPESPEHLMEYYKADTALYPPVDKYINPKNEVDRIHGREYFNEAEKAKCYILDFVWYILNKQQELPQHVVFFRTVLNKQHNKDNTSLADEFRSFMKDHPDKFNISFTPHPEYDIFLIMRSNAEWQDVTLDFDRAEIINIVHRFSKNEQQKIISFIKEAYLARKGDGIESVISSVTYHKRANENFLDNLAKEENLQMLNAITSTSKTITEDTTPHSGFESYIIKDHDKVMNILMLIAYMGNSQVASIIKFIKAFQQLEYIREDCFEDLDLFIENAEEQFTDISFDKNNLKRYIKRGTKLSDSEYAEEVKRTAKYLLPLL